MGKKVYEKRTENIKMQKDLFLHYYAYILHNLQHGLQFSVVFGLQKELFACMYVAEMSSHVLC